LRSPTGKPLYLPPVRANAGLRVAYNARLEALVEEMNHSLLYWIGAAWKKNEPEVARLALDASPARNLLDVIRRLAARWQKRFDELAPDLARWFAVSAQQRSDAALKASLRKAGFTVRFKMSRATNDALQASIGENVGLIKSIPSEYLTQVQGAVMRSVQQGRNLGELAAELENHYGVTRRRAALISRDQNNKLTAVISRTRQQELGITQARWVHSTAGKVPRPSHLKASRERVVFSLADGWYDPDEGKRIWPGELINCRCTAAPIIPGFR
jgi:SPP1 gp7 family putative phage head morphogenesis protein